MYKEKITVVIPVYNREKFIKTAIDSVLKQTLKDWKMIIVDDCSTDHTPDIVRSYQSKKIKYVQLKKNVGTGRVLQTALRMITTPFFMILDSDDWIEPRTLEILLKEMEKQPPTTSMVFANTITWTRRNGKFLRSVKKHHSFYDHYDFLMYGPMLYPRFLRTKTVRQVKGFENDDPHQGRYAEDRYLLLKLIGTSNFHWVDKNLYHLRRTNHDNVTNGKNRKYFADTLRYIYTKILKEWGDEYTPVFKINKYGWLYIAELKEKK